MLTTKDDYFKARYGNSLGDVEYDTSLPQTPLDDIKAKTGEYCRMFVYGYSRTLGEGLIPLTDSAEMLLRIYAHITGSDLSYPPLKQGW